MKTTLDLPSHSCDDSERAVILAALADPKAARIAFDELQPEQFEKYRALFKALAAIFLLRGSLCDELLVSGDLKHNGTLHVIGGREALGTFYFDATGIHAANIEEHVTRVKQFAEARQIQGAMAATLQRINAAPEQASALLAAFRAENNRVAQVCGSRSLNDIIESAEFLQGITRIETTYPELDKALNGGTVPGGLYIVAASTSGFKSAMEANIGRRSALDGTKTHIITLEDPAIQVARKIFAASAHVPLIALERMSFTTPQKAALTSTKKTLLNVPLTIDGSTSTIAGIETALRAHAAQGCKVALIDQLSHIVCDARDSFERAAIISRRLKQLAASTGLVIWLAVQVNRAGSQKEDGPELYDLRDSGTLEQDADGVLLIKRREKISDEISVLTFELAKHRHGPRNETFNLTVYPIEQRIESFNPADVTGVHS